MFMLGGEALKDNLESARALKLLVLLSTSNHSMASQLTILPAAHSSVLPLLVTVIFGVGVRLGLDSSRQRTRDSSNCLRRFKFTTSLARILYSVQLVSAMLLPLQTKASSSLGVSMCTDSLAREISILDTPPKLFNMLQPETNCNLSSK